MTMVVLVSAGRMYRPSFSLTVSALNSALPQALLL